MGFSSAGAVFAAACLLYALLDLQLLRGLRKLRVGRKADAGPTTPSVTILIAARNEETSLPATLDALLAQDYPTEKTQILVANDRSEDGTEAVLKRYAENHPGRIEFVPIDAVPSGMSPKKNALLKGLEKARGEWVATTDADCRMGPRWLSGLSREFDPSVGMVLGMTCYDGDARFGLGPGARALEFASYGVVSAALIGLGFPVHANANSLAYRRAAFDEAETFRKHGHVVSGDDDFTLQEIHATGRWGVRFCANPDALVRTEAPQSWSQFWEQRKRWASKCGLYRPKPLLFLVCIFAFYAAIPILLAAGLWDARWAYLGLAGFAVKTGADYAVMRRGLSDFRLGALLRFYPPTALLHIPLILAAVLAGTFGGFTWKGQKMKREMR